MQKGTVCGASRSVYNLNFFPWIFFFFLHFCFEFSVNAHIYKKNKQTKRLGWKIYTDF